MIFTDYRTMNRNFAVGYIFFALAAAILGFMALPSQPPRPSFNTVQPGTPLVVGVARN
jgi:hypothetical protein